MKTTPTKNRLTFPCLNTRTAGVSADEQAFWDSDTGSHSVLSVAWNWKTGPALHYLFKSLWESERFGLTLKFTVSFTLALVAFSAFALTIICQAKG